MNSALESLKVVEISHYIAGPYSGQILADLGADVIKVERPAGEAAREFGPYVNGISTYYASYNRNKKAVTVDFKSEEGKAFFKKLASQADVIIDNQKPGFLDKMGFSYEEMSKYNPGLVLTQISGYGQYGPMYKRPALDMIVQGVGGIMAMTGFPDNPPTKAGFAVIDFSTALYAVIGTLAALAAREKTGRGQCVDVAMLDSTITLLENWPALNVMTGFEPPRVGNTRITTGPSNAYKTKDGYAYIAAVANNNFTNLAKLIGHPELLEDPELSTSALRRKHQKDLDDLIAPWAAPYTTEEVVNILSDAAITAGPVNTIPDLVKMEQIKVREMLITMNHPDKEDLVLLGNPIKLSETPVQYKTAPPAVGQHNREVMESFGYTKEEIDEYIQKYGFKKSTQ